MTSRQSAREWIKAALGLAAGALFLFAVEVAWVLDSGLIVRKSDAAARRQREQMYDGFAVNPINEMPGESQ